MEAVVRFFAPDGQKVRPAVAPRHMPELPQNDGHEAEAAASRARRGQRADCAGNGRRTGAGEASRKLRGAGPRRPFKRPFPRRAAKRKFSGSGCKTQTFESARLFPFRSRLFEGNASGDDPDAGEDGQRQAMVSGDHQGACRYACEGKSGCRRKPAYDQRLFSNKDFRKYILTRDHYTCYFCGEYGDTIDHLLPRAKGGHTTPDNCVCACNVCNQSKADKDLEQFMREI
jgi:hypothetical protein